MITQIKLCFKDHIEIVAWEIYYENDHQEKEKFKLNVFNWKLLSNASVM